MERMVLHQDLTGRKVSGANHTSTHVVAILALAVEALKEIHLQGTWETDHALVTTAREAFGESYTWRLLALCQVGDT